MRSGERRERAERVPRVTEVGKRNYWLCSPRRLHASASPGEEGEGGGRRGGRREKGSREGEQRGAVIGTYSDPPLLSFLTASAFHSCTTLSSKQSPPPLPPGEAVPTSGFCTIQGHRRAVGCGGKFWSHITWAKIPGFPLTKLCSLDQVP